MLQNFNLTRIIFVLPAILLGLTVHEFAHSLAALRLGDDTPRRLGRLTLNPLKHIDLIGFLLLLVVGFGWAKPVVINRENLKHPVRDDILISLAGPASNFCFAVLVALLMRALYLVAPPGMSLETFLVIIITINIGLAVFNLIPLPPLDGSHLVLNLLSLKSSTAAMAYYRYGSYVLLGLIMISFLTNSNILSINKVMDPIIEMFVRIPLPGFSLTPR